MTAERDRTEFERMLQIAEQPILADLALAGVEIDSVWNIYLVPELRAKAVPVLLEHLSRDYPARVLEGVAYALADKSVRSWWAQLKALYLATDRPEVQDGLAVALSTCARREHYDDLLFFLDQVALGESRIYFLRPVNRIGNRISPGRGRCVIESFATDPSLGTEANRILAGRGPSE